MFDVDFSSTISSFWQQKRDNQQNVRRSHNAGVLFGRSTINLRWVSVSRSGNSQYRDLI